MNMRKPIRRSPERRRRAMVIEARGGRLTPGEDLMHEVYARRSKETAKSLSLDLESFSHIPLEERARDIKFESRLREKFARQRGSERGKIMELFLENEIEGSDWFADAYVGRTTEFDDFKGTDLLLEWEPKVEGGFVSRLAIDVTTTDTGHEIDRKIQKLEKGARVKYFRSEAEDEKEIDLKRLPIVILGLDANLLPNLGDVAEREKRSRKGKEDISRRAFAEHPVRLLLLEQARVQLDLQVENAGADLSRFLRGVRDASVRKVLESYRLSDGNADDVLETLGTLPMNVLRNKDFREYWQNTLACKAHVDQTIANILENLKDAQMDEVKAWVRASRTHAELTKKAA